jgi:hypothetical protein
VLQGQGIATSLRSSQWQVGVGRPVVVRRVEAVGVTSLLFRSVYGINQ